MNERPTETTPEPVITLTAFEVQWIAACVQCLLAVQASDDAGRDRSVWFAKLAEDVAPDRIAALRERIKAAQQKEWGA